MDLSVIFFERALLNPFLVKREYARGTEVFGEHIVRVETWRDIQVGTSFCY